MIRNIAPIDMLTAIATVVLLLFPGAFSLDGVEVAELELELAEFEIASVKVELNLENLDEFDNAALGGLIVGVKDWRGGQRA